MLCYCQLKSFFSLHASFGTFCLLCYCVVRVWRLLPTGMQRMSACSCISNLLDVMPPSTCSCVRGTPLSWFMASRIWYTPCEKRDHVQNNCAMDLNSSSFVKKWLMKEQLTSLVWKQTASRAAKAKWFLLVNWVRPQMILKVYKEKKVCILNKNWYKTINLIKSNNYDSGCPDVCWQLPHPLALGSQ